MNSVGLTQLIKKYQHLELLEFQPKVAVILGNGSSSKLLNFELLEGGHIATVGMNAAYRYWNEINFRPTHYICMDVVVIQSHADVIYKLIHERRIKKFFLRDEIKDIYPDIGDLDHIFWYSRAVKEYEIFQTNYITTGSWAIRWMAYERMKIIATIGIDANYVELLPDAKKIGTDDNDLRLKIDQTPNFNPNYFFSKYQQAGDQYNIPNDPNYVRNNNGNLVHIDALKDVSKSLKWFEMECKIYDLSPISSHGIFEKMPLQQFFDSLKISVVTSFRQESSISLAIKINIEMLILNISNPFVREIVLLFEGCWTSFESALPLDQQMFFKQAIKNKKLYVTETSERPSYWHLFNLANQFGIGLCLIQNSDIYIPVLSAEKLIIDAFSTINKFHVLTRWNLTIHGTFLQSLTPSPPWSEIEFSNFSRKDKNYFSYDTYCLNTPILVPESTRKVLLGSLGCDTALAAIFKSSGFTVSNPCLRYEFIHVDDKPRNYHSDQSRNDLILNVDAVVETIRKKWDKHLIGKSLEYLPSLRRYVAWIGHIGAISPWHAIYRVLGATPWSESIFPKKMNFKKICLTSQQLDSENLSFDPCELLKEMEDREIFFEWELSGFETPEHIVKLLSKTQSCRTLSDFLSTYPWISMIHVDKAQPEEVSAVFDVIVLIKECLMYYSVHTDTGHVVPVVLDTPKIITNGQASVKKIQYVFEESGPNNNVVFAFDIIVKSGNVAKAKIKLLGERNSRLVICLCRDGRTPYEGQNKNVLLTGESQEFDIIHCFDKKHKGIRIQIYSPDGRLTISDVNVVVTIKDSRNNEILTPLVEPCSVNSLLDHMLNENSNVSQQSLLTERSRENTNKMNLMTQKPYKVILIDPDAKSWSGHYMAYNAKLSEQLLNLGSKVWVICRKDIDTKILTKYPNYIPALSTHSWEVGNRAKNQEFIKNFEAEVSAVLDSIFQEYNEPMLLYMYCGSVEHAQVFSRLFRQYRHLHVNVNLFWLSFTLTYEYAQSCKDFFKWLNKEMVNSKFFVTLPTQELQNELFKYTGYTLPVAPHPSTGISDQKFLEINEKPKITDSQKLFRVLFPSAPREEKGYLASIEGACFLADNQNMQVSIRYSPTFSTPKHLNQVLTDIPSNVEIIEGELLDDDFLGLFSRSDIVVLPYTREAFAKRTSGLLIDSLYHGIPCVVVRGTWLGNFVERYDCGLAIEDTSKYCIAKAVVKIAENYIEFHSRSKRAANFYFSRNSWKTFADFLLNPAILQKSSITLYQHPIIGPYSRNDCAHWDETDGVFQLFESILTGSTMIDVGAHHGFSLLPFLKKGWKIYAFEPDDNNRAKLLDLLNSQKGRELVTLDTRCVSNKSQQNVPFYCSEQSTGISGLSAFHESHIEAQRVDTISLKDFFQDKPLPKIDFLKIDTEGNDLFVLQGFPWERCKPSIIECEFEDIKTVPLGYTFHDLARFLVEKGYTVYVSEWHPIIRYGIRHDWNGIRLYPCELADTKGWGNLLAFLDPIDEKALIDAVTKVLKLNPEKQSKPMAGLVSESLNMPNISSTTSIRFYELSCSSYFTALSEKTWRYTHPGKDFPQNQWLVAFDVFDSTLDRSYVSGIRLMSNKKMTVRVTLGRQGNTEWEGAVKLTCLQQNVSQSVKINHKFVQQHEQVKVQIQVLEIEDGNIADLTFDDIYVHESLDSLRQRLSENEINLSVANRRFREGDYETAMGIYLLLHQKHPLPFDLYFQNAMMAAQKLGIDSVKTIDELMKRVSFQI